MKTSTALTGGLAGASALTFIHEATRKINPKAPRMDLLGMNALSNLLKNAKANIPDRNKLFFITLAGDMVGNALYYSLAGAGKQKGVWWRGAILGLAAGIGAIYLPKPLALNKAYSSRTLETKLMTLGLYLAGGLAAAAIARLLEKKKEKPGTTDQVDNRYAY